MLPILKLMLPVIAVAILCGVALAILVQFGPVP